MNDTALGSFDFVIYFTKVHTNIQVNRMRGKQMTDDQLEHSPARKKKLSLWKVEVAFGRF